MARSTDLAAPISEDCAIDERSWRYRGWRAVLMCFFLAICAWGFGFYGQSVFLAELQQRHGWSSSLIGTATTVYYLFGACLIAFVSDAAARLGARRFLLIGLAALFVSVALVPFVSSPWQLYADYLLMSVGWAGTSLAAIMTVLGSWFEARRGMAISLALNGASAASFVVVPLMVALTTGLGFAAAMLVAVALCAAVVVPMVLGWANGAPPLPAPANAALPQHQAVGSARIKTELLRSAAFWSVALPFALGIAAQVGFLVHQIAILEPRLGRIDAGAAVALTGASALVGRLAFSLFIDRLDQRKATATLLVEQAVSLLVIIRTDEPPVLFIACAFFGAAVGNLITLPALIVQREFPPERFAVVSTLANSVAAFTYALAPGIVGMVHDLANGYAAALGLCMAAEILAAAIVMTRPRRRSATA